MNVCGEQRFVVLLKPPCWVSFLRSLVLDASLQPLAFWGQHGFRVQHERVTLWGSSIHAFCASTRWLPYGVWRSFSLHVYSLRTSLGVSSGHSSPKQWLCSEVGPWYPQDFEKESLGGKCYVLVCVVVVWLAGLFQGKVRNLKKKNHDTKAVKSSLTAAFHRDVANPITEVGYYCTVSPPFAI